MFNRKSTNKDETLSDLLRQSGSPRTTADDERDDDPQWFKNLVTSANQAGANVDKAARTVRRKESGASGRPLSGPELRMTIKAYAAGEEPVDVESLLKQIPQAVQAGDYAGCMDLCDQLAAYCADMQDASEQSADVRSGQATLTGDTPTAKAGRTEGIFGPGTMPIRSDPTPRRAKQGSGSPLFNGTPGLRVKSADSGRQTPRENNPLWDRPLRSSFMAGRSLLSHIADELFDRLDRR